MSIGRFDTAYLPSIEYMKCLASCEAFFIDGSSFYQKQTVRNRTFILSPNGVQVLTVPVQHTGGQKVPVSDIRISYAMNWVRQHMGALDAAYNRSAFYEFLRDDIAHVLQSKPEYLIELNDRLLDVLNKKARKTPRVSPIQEGFQSFASLSNAADCLPVMLQEKDFSPYLQVFSDRFPFQQNLSALDLLCNGSPL